ncbi:MAG: ATP-dependent zinc metalloprotease FtsH [Betaproteobacteria bacterium]
MKFSPRGIALSLLVILIAGWLFDGGQLVRNDVTLDYSEFMRQLDAGNVRDLDVGEQLLRGEFVNPPDGKSRRFVTRRVDPDFAGQLGASAVRFRAVADPATVSALLSGLTTVLLLVLLWLFVAARACLGNGAASSLMGIGRSRARVYMQTGIRVSFEDVAGVDEAKEELREIVEFLKDPQSHGRLGARVPRGVLLVGPPGTGKTLLAKAVAGEAGVPFFSINGSEFVELFVGVGAARVRDLFEQARSRAPAIVFIDEIDALGRARGAFGSGGHDEKEQTLNQLLAELDGFDPSSGVVLLAATNRPEILDPALLRAGRFDRQVLVDRPDRAGRVQILRVHLRRIRLDPGVDIDVLASLTPGFSGADLANLVNEAALLATRRMHRAVVADDFTVALERIVAGLEKRNRLLNAAERRTVAFHEMGHALAAIALLPGETVHKVSIIPRGISALGYTIQRPTEDRFLMTRAELTDKLTVLLAGRAAEQLCLGEISTGAADDLIRATRVARSMVTQYGMHPVLGAQAFESSDPGHSPTEYPPLASTAGPPSDATAREIDCAVRDLMEQGLVRGLDLLRARRDRLERGAAELLARETLSGEELLAVCNGLVEHQPAKGVTKDSPARATIATSRP